MALGATDYSTDSLVLRLFLDFPLSLPPVWLPISEYLGVYVVRVSENSRGIPNPK